MNRNTSRAARTVALLTAAALILAVGACTKSKSGGGTGESVPGVTDTTITIGTHQPLTGPAAPGYSKISAATKAYFAYVNANGGINGRTIDYKVMDDGYNPANTQTVVRQLVLEDKVFAIVGGLGTPTHTGVLDFLKTNGVPDLFVASGSRSWNQPDKYPGTFGYQPDYTVEGKILGTHLKANFADRKVCFFGQDDDFGTDMLAGLTQILGDTGVAEKQKYTVTNQNVAPQIGALAQAQCQVVVAATVPGFTTLALLTANTLKFRPQWVVSNVGADYADRRRPAHRQGCAAAGGRDQRQLPAERRGRHEPVDPVVHEDQQGPQQRRPDRRQRHLRVRRWGTCSPRRCSAPVRS